MMLTALDMLDYRSKNKSPAIFHLFLTILLMLFIFWQSAMPAAVSELESDSIVSRLAEWLQADEDLVSFAVRKSAHFAEFLLLGTILFLTVRDLWKRASFWIPWAIGAAYAVSDELHQHFVPGRSCEVRDMIIDACGVLVGVAMCWWVARKKQNSI